ncbi:hypothetical protein KSC_088300 [Ktedonobacter sp. SOSP1-52]|uniref:phosphotransferase family protein n=1 Tax=Ktedonobacter sp. SOSP1-52 TaxID=2778366 RepID=UPI0019156436|nr:phosphotransferase [Ktedonobacter sp. SOSP1-52]GHO69938.1 hypothetical protein KSC_088300 [Ktedonobacter sp. SOSP1-52]
MPARIYTQHLGSIANKQLQEALTRFQLGTVLQAEPVPFGNFGQNIFLTTTQGEFVLRGKPLWPEQFARERWFMQQLHKHTTVPVPWPYLHDPDTDIFGWSYILMPRMPGLALIDPVVRRQLSDQQRQQIAAALGVTLAQMHALTWPTPGEHDATHDTIVPFHPSYAGYITGEIYRLLSLSRQATNLTTEADSFWVETLVEQGKRALAEPFQARFVMGDYKEGNIVVEERDAEWHVSGVFDVHGHFGDAEEDLARPIADYMTQERVDLAHIFLRTYLQLQPPRPGFEARFPLYMLKERLAIWEWAHRTDMVWWQRDLTLREWIEPFLSIAGT